MTKKDQLLALAKDVYDRRPYDGRMYSISDNARIMASELLLEVAMSRVGLNFDIAEPKFKIEMINDLEIAIRNCVQTKHLED